MEEVEQKFIDIHPLSKWKRLLVFLGDYFIAFIISFLLFNVAIFPLAGSIANADEQSQKADALEQKALKMLKDDGYLFIPNDGASFIEDVNYTFKVFLSYYAFDEVAPDSNNPQYGHKIENEVVRHYYESVIKDTSQYVVDFKEVNAKDNMFDIGEVVDSIVLKADYKVILANELIEVTNEDDYSETMTNFRDHVFAQLFYVHVYNHILENDYVKDGESYYALINEARSIAKTMQWVPTLSSFVAILVSWSFVFVLYPLLNAENRTMTLSVMGISKLHYKSLGPVDKKNVMIQSFYQFVFMLSSALFMPVIYFGLAYCFNLPLLFIISLCSLALIIVSGVIIIFNQYNRSGMDLLTMVVLVPNSELDYMYLENLKNGNE